MTGLAKRFVRLADLNKHAFDDPRVEVVSQDAMIWLEEGESKFDAAIIDFPDPSTYAVGKLYTTRFYRLLQRRLEDGAAVAVQATSPLFARRSYWCIVRTMEAAGFQVRPYHVPVPAFGVWGFVLAMRERFEPPTHAPPGLRFLDAEALKGMFSLPVDLGQGPEPVEINRLDNQVLVRYYDEEWRKWN
jgi:spermidine synthase